ncbi:hypothetical protein MAR_004251, partial [Mya arenaria]
MELKKRLQRPSLELDVIINTNEVQHFLQHSYDVFNGKRKETRAEMDARRKRDVYRAMPDQLTQNELGR